MMKFISFGSGSSGNCYYIASETTAILVDAGISIRRIKRYFKDYGIKSPTIKAILITHDHADHIKAAGYISNELSIPVYTTEPIHEGMLRNYNAFKKVEAANARYIETGNILEIGDLRITAFQLPHDSTENVGYQIETGNSNTLAIMTDVGMPTETMKNVISHCKHIVIEANYDEVMLKNGNYPSHLKARITSGTGHLSNKQTAEFLATNFHEHIANIWLCHLSEENNHPELARKTIESHLNSYGLISGKDYKLDVLRRNIPTGPYELK
jgi:phosphoribosyl 1,2-cyclic phosphodiesterase